MFQTELDCKGMRCPMPIVKISLAVKQLQAGERIVVEATDPAFHPDLVAWTRQLGHLLIEFEDGPVQRAVIEKCPWRGGNAPPAQRTAPWNP